MPLMTVESVYGIYGCGGLYMAFMVVEFNVCH